MIQTSVIETALELEAFVVKATDGSVWSGTRYWMVREPHAFEPTAEIIQKAVDGLANASHELTWAQEAGMGKIVRPSVRRDDIVRVYERDDGATVLVNEAFIKVIERMVLTIEPEFDIDDDDSWEPSVYPYALRQVDDPLGPIAVVTEKGEIVATVMPIRKA